MNENVIVGALSVDDPMGMRPVAPLRDPMIQDTAAYDKIFWKNIRHVCAEPWTLGRKFSPDSGVIEAPETGYPELVLVQILLRSI